MQKKKELLSEVIKLVRIQLGLKNVLEDDRFMEDLGAESVDIINIIATSEDRFNIRFDEMDIPEILTVKQLFNYILNQTKK